MVRRLRILFCLLVLILGGAKAANVEQIVKEVFPMATKIEPDKVILTRSEAQEVMRRAKMKLPSRLYRIFRIYRGKKELADGVVITRKVRSKKASVLYLFDHEGKLLFAEVLAFAEPSEFLPSKVWMGQFQDKSPDAPLRVGKDIPTISGATLSARNITDGARLARALVEVVLR